MAVIVHFDLTINPLIIEYIISVYYNKYYNIRCRLLMSHKIQVNTYIVQVAQQCNNQAASISNSCCDI